MKLKKKAILLLACSMIFISQFGMAKALDESDYSFNTTKNLSGWKFSAEEQQIIPCVIPDPHTD